MFTDTTQLANLVQTAYDRYVEMALRAMPLFRSVVDKHPGQQAMPGSSVVLNLYADLADAVTPLSEDTDVTAVGIPATTNVTITLAEYGNAAVVSRKLRALAFSDIDPAVVNMIAFNEASTVDTLVQTVLRGMTNVIHENSGTITYNTGTTVLTASTDVFKSQIARTAVAKLRTQLSMPKRDNLYACYLHPEVSYDLRAESGSTGWLPPHQYSAPDAIWAAEIGNYEGAFYVESPRCYQATDGVSSTRVFRSYYLGQQALAEATSEDFHVELGPVVDRLNRLQPIGWYGIAGWSGYRQASAVRTETTSSIHTT